MIEGNGNKRPPKNTRWRKGQSGNPSGRPKGKANFMTDLAAELAETIAVTVNGKTKHMTKQRALIKSATASGIKGDFRATQLLFKLAAAIADDPGGSKGPPPLTTAERKILADYLERHPVAPEDE